MVHQEIDGTMDTSTGTAGQALPNGRKHGSNDGQAHAYKKFLSNERTKFVPKAAPYYDQRGPPLGPPRGLPRGPPFVGGGFPPAAQQDPLHLAHFAGDLTKLFTSTHVSTTIDDEQRQQPLSLISGNSPPPAIKKRQAHLVYSTDDATEIGTTAKDRNVTKSTRTLNGEQNASKTGQGDGGETPPTSRSLDAICSSSANLSHRLALHSGNSVDGQTTLSRSDPPKRAFVDKLPQGSKLAVDAEPAQATINSTLAHMSNSTGQGNGGDVAEGQKAGLVKVGEVFPMQCVQYNVFCIALLQMYCMAHV